MIINLFFAEIISAFNIITGLKTIGLSIVAFWLIAFFFSIPFCIISRFVKNKKTLNITTCIIYFLFSGVFLKLSVNISIFLLGI